MPPPVKDPKGYYRILGVSPKADSAAVKRAYRARAFALHPDRNDSPNAVAEFQKLQDAYHTVMDPDARALYDRSGLKPRARAAATTTAAAPRHQPPPPRLAPRTCQSCGKVTAQPRFVILEKTTGRLWRSQQESISGVFCRRCADRLAFFASLHCWVRGWWAFPTGPFHTLVALAINLMGGLKPRRENSLLLLEQARAFLVQGKRELAYELATQARSLAKAAKDRAPAERLLNALGGLDLPHRRLRNPWSGLGRGFWLQLTPPATLAVVGLFVVLPWLRPTPPTPAPLGVERVLPRIPSPRDTGPALRSGARIHVVSVPKVALRTGPGPQYEAAALVTQGTFLIVMEVDPATGWARALTAQGLVGFVPLELLRPTVPPPEVPAGDPDTPDAAPAEGRLGGWR